MDFSRLRQGEIIAGLAGLALIITLFLDWYGAGDESASGWDSLTDFDGFLIAAAGVAGIALAAAGRGRPQGQPRRPAAGLRHRGPRCARGGPDRLADVRRPLLVG